MATGEEYRELDGTLYTYPIDLQERTVSKR